MDNRVGNLIRLKRIEKSLTQGELCEGICTSSYLSRIENNLVTPDEDIIKLLFDKLGIHYNDVLYDTKDFTMRIDKWYQDMLERKNINENIYELKQYSRRVNSEYSIRFDIVYCRYLLVNKKLEEVGKKIKDLNSILKPSSTRNYFLFTNVLIAYYYSLNNYNKAIEIGIDLIKYNWSDFIASYEIGVLYYKLGLCYSKINQYERCIHFSSKALDIFHNHYYLDRTIDCHILLGISYNNFNLTDKAIESYQIAKKIVELLPENKGKNYLSIIHNNIGFCYEKRKDFNKAIFNYTQSLEQKENEQERLRTIINLVRCHLLLNDKGSAKNWLLISKDIVNENTPKTQKLQIEVYKMVLLQKKPSIMEISNLEKSCINYFYNKNRLELVYEYCLIFANLYEKTFHYKHSNKMYKLAIEVSQI